MSRSTNGVVTSCVYCVVLSGVSNNGYYLLVLVNTKLNQSCITNNTWVYFYTLTL